jgi:hypothetical protein
MSTKANLEFTVNGMVVLDLGKLGIDEALKSDLQDEGVEWSVRVYDREFLTDDELLGTGYLSIHRPVDNANTAEDESNKIELHFKTPIVFRSDKFEGELEDRLPELYVQVRTESAPDPQELRFSTRRSEPLRFGPDPGQPSTSSANLYRGKAKGNVVVGSVRAQLTWSPLGAGDGLAEPTSLPRFAVGGAITPSPVTTGLDRPFEVRLDPEVFRALSSRGQHVSLGRTAVASSDDQAFWVAIRNMTDAIGFSSYKQFVDNVLCPTPDTWTLGAEDDPGERGEAGLRRALGNSLPSRANLYVSGVDAFNLLKVATDVFLLMNAGRLSTDPFDSREEASRLGDTIPAEVIEQRLAAYLGSDKLPYIKLILETNLRDEPTVDSPYCAGVLRSRIDTPRMLELIWSYWHEEGMLVQTMNAIGMRFQNRRSRATRLDPLVNLTLDPLRPMSNLFWGYIQDEPHRLSVVRRAYEYDSQYGLTLVGKAVPPIDSAESRTKFLEAFHYLLHQAQLFYREDDDTTVLSDAFPLLNALKEVHLNLAEGAHNQFGDLTWVARSEMLVMQWMLARRELREFLAGRPMVPYKEAWMPQVETMKSLQGWPDVSVTHLRDLGVFGEQILLSVRYGNWIKVIDQAQAANWARYWRPEIQGYVHAYRAVTGVDLTMEVAETQPVGQRDLPPAYHIQRRLAAQTRRGAAATGPAAIGPAALSATSAPMPTASGSRVGRNGRG